MRKKWCDQWHCHWIKETNFRRTNWHIEKCYFDRLIHPKAATAQKCYRKTRNDFSLFLKAMLKAFVLKQSVTKFCYIRCDIDRCPERITKINQLNKILFTFSRSLTEKVTLMRELWKNTFDFDEKWIWRWNFQIKNEWRNEKTSPCRQKYIDRNRTLDSTQTKFYLFSFVAIVNSVVKWIPRRFTSLAWVVHSFNQRFYW